MKIAITDKVMKHFMEQKDIDDYISCANEGEAIAIAGGHFLATLERADVYMSADGFCNALNFITSWVIPDKIEMNIYVSTGREEPSHKVMTDILPELLELLDYDTDKLFIDMIWK